MASGDPCTAKAQFYVAQVGVVRTTLCHTLAMPLLKSVERK